MANLWHHLYNDFLMPSRMKEFERLINLAHNCKYQVLSLADYYQRVRRGPVQEGERLLLLRCDVESSPDVALAMYRVLREGYGFSGSFFFRLAAMDFRIMEYIHRHGGHVGYRYEELSTWAKTQRKLDADRVTYCLPRIREKFLDNVYLIRKVSGLPLLDVAPHHDFVNSKLGIENAVILQDTMTRGYGGIRFETGDPCFVAADMTRIADGMYPDFWNPVPPRLALEQGIPVVSLVVHPRRWKAAPLENGRKDLLRLCEELWFAGVKPVSLA